MAYMWERSHVKLNLIRTYVYKCIDILLVYPCNRDDTKGGTDYAMSNYTFDGVDEMEVVDQGVGQGAQVEPGWHNQTFDFLFPRVSLFYVSIVGEREKHFSQNFYSIYLCMHINRQ